MAVSGRLFKRSLRVAAAVRLRRWAARTVSAVCPEVIYVTTAIASRRAACAVAVVFVHFATTTAGIFVGRLVQYVRIACRAAGVWVAGDVIANKRPRDNLRIEERTNVKASNALLFTSL